MSGDIGKRNNLLQKGQRQLSSDAQSFAVTKFEIFHEAAEGDKKILFNSLNRPSDMSGSNPSPSALINLNLSYTKPGIKVQSSRGFLLFPERQYTVRNEGIYFTDDYTAMDGEIFYISIEQGPVNGNLLVNAEKNPITYVLPAGQTTISVGEVFRPGANINHNVGDVMVFAKNIQIYRNTNNSATNQDADYYEPNNQTIELNTPFSEDVAIAVIPTSSYVERPDLSVIQRIETLAGQIDNIVPVLSDVADVDESQFQTGANSVDLKNFSDKVLQLLAFNDAIPGLNSGFFDKLKWQSTQLGTNITSDAQEVDLFQNLETGKYYLLLWVANHQGTNGNFHNSLVLNGSTQVADTSTRGVLSGDPGLTAHQLVPSFAVFRADDSRLYVTGANLGADKFIDANSYAVLIQVPFGMATGNWI